MMLHDIFSVQKDVPFEGFVDMVDIPGVKSTKPVSTSTKFCTRLIDHFTIIIDFPSLGTTYNGGWCSATKTR